MAATGSHYAGEATILGWLPAGQDHDALLLQILKLPAGKYTVREQEMLSSFAPQEFFSNVTHMSKGTIIASAALLGAAIFIWRQKNDEY